MDKVYILFGGCKYEGVFPEKIFEKESDAISAMEACIKHSGEEPEYPRANDPEQNSKMLVWREWRSKDPFGKDGSSSPLYYVQGFDIKKDGI